MKNRLFRILLDDGAGDSGGGGGEEGQGDTLEGTPLNDGGGSGGGGGDKKGFMEGVMEEINRGSGGSSRARGGTEDRSDDDGEGEDTSPEDGKDGKDGKAKPDPKDDDANLLPKKREKPQPKKPDPAAGDRQQQGTGAEPKTNPELRKAYESTKQRVAALEAENATLKKGPTGGKVKETAEYRELQAAHDALKADRDSLATEVGILDYGRSPEYAEKYEKPFKAAFNRAIKNLEGVTIAGEDGNGRALDVQSDIWPWMQMSGHGRTQSMKAKLGENYAEVRRVLDPIFDKFEEKTEALSTFRAQGKQRLAEREAEGQRRWEALKTQFTESLEATYADNPELYGERPDSDPDKAAIADAMTYGKRLGNLAFIEQEGLSQDRVVELQKALVARSTAYGVLQVMNERLEKRIAEMEERLKGYEESDPHTGGNDGKGGDGGGGNPYEVRTGSVADGFMTSFGKRLGRRLG